MNKRDVAIALIFFLIGIVGMYLHSRNEITENKRITRRIIENSILGFTASQKLIASCSNAYTEATTCLANLSTCNIEESTKKLQTLNRGKEEAEEELKKANMDVQAIIENILKGR